MRVDCGSGFQETAKYSKDGRKFNPSRPLLHSRPRPLPLEPAKLAEGAFGLITGPRTHVRIFFDEKVSHFVRRRQWHPTQEIKRVPTGIELTMEVSGTVELVSWVLGFGRQAEVLEPDSLREELALELRGAAKRYDTPPIS